MLAHRLGFCLLFSAVALALASCTRSSIPLQVEEMQATPPTASPTAASSGEETAGYDGPARYAVVWVSEGEALALRETAGITGRIVTEVSAETRVQRTGRTTRLGSSTWLEVEAPSGAVGWAPGWNLTEYVPGESFCSDPRAQQLIEDFEAAVEAEDGAALRSLLSPVRGLVVRVDPWNPEIQIPVEEALSVFTDARSLEWGTRYASNAPIRGSFVQIVLPSLREALRRVEEPKCNELVLGSGAGDQRWPPEYANLNFYSLIARPETSQNPYNWRTWVIGIEYVDGQPYIALLVQFRPQA